MLLWIICVFDFYFGFISVLIVIFYIFEGFLKGFFVGNLLYVNFDIVIGICF